MLAGTSDLSVPSIPDTIGVTYRVQYRQAISAFDNMSDNELLRHFFGGFIRLHILYHAAQEPVCGIEMIAELKRHGYKLGPGTMYPILHHLEKGGYIVAEAEVLKGKRRKNYRITRKGLRLMTQAQEKLKELFSEVIEHSDLKEKPPS